MAVSRCSKLFAFLVVSFLASMALALTIIAPAHAEITAGQAAGDRAALTAAASEYDASIDSPNDGAKFEIGKAISVKVKAKYHRVNNNVFNAPHNYIYVKVTKDGEEVKYLSKDFGTLFGAESTYTTTLDSFTLGVEGRYLIEAHHDWTYNGDNHVDLASEDFTADDSITIIVQKSIKNAEISGLEDMVYNGQPLTPSPVVTIDGKTLDPDTDYDVTYASNTNVGEATVTVKGKGFYKDSATATFNITSADIAQAAMGGIVDKTYTGSAITQEPSVTWNGRQLVAGTDYDLVYEGNTNAGTATVTANGKGNFTGSLPADFSIGKASIHNVSEPAIVNKTYTGSPITQNLNLQYGGKTLAEGEDKDYTVTYANNVNPGTATVTIVGKGNFRDSMTRTFSINEVANSPSADVVILSPEDGSTYSTGSTIPLKVKVNKFELPQYNGQPINGVPNFIYARVFRNGNPYETVSKQYTSAGVELTLNVPAEDAGTYEIQACWITWTFQAVIEDERVALNYYQPGFWDFKPSDSITAYVGVSAPASSNISGATITGLAATKEYTGNSIMQNPTVKLGGKTLKSGTDYYITYKSLTYASNPANNVDIGDVEMTIHGMGSYKGSKTSSFAITPKTVAEGMIILTPSSFAYNGELQKPQVTVMNGSVLLSETNDYALTNEGGTEPGSYAVKITGKGNYQGEAVKNYSINKWSISRAVVICDPATFIYDGTAKEPSVSVMLDGKVIPPEAYDVSYAKNTDAGTATVTVTAKANSYYTGSASGTFTINSLNIATDAVSVAPLGSVTYNRAPQTPEPQVMMGETVLKKGSDYSLSYEGNTNAGAAAKVIVTGKGNFKGSRTVSFTIDRKSIGDESITVDPVAYQRYADGAPITPSITVKDGDAVLGDEEYSVEYTNNTAVGTASATITGKGNYQGARGDVEFQILDRDEYAVTALTDAVSEVAQEGTDQYLDADKQAVEEALAAANELLNDESATTGDLEQALENLSAAVTTAKKNAAKKSLADAVSAVEREGTGKYLADDQTAVQAALGEAKALLADESTTAEALKQALETLNAAVSAAKKNLARAQAEQARKQAMAEALTMPSAELVAKAILAQKTDKDPAGSTFAPLQLKSTKQTKKQNVLAWGKVAGASRYEVYGAKCGKSNRIAKIATVTANKFTHKKLKKGTYYKYVVVAVKDTVAGPRAAAVSKMIHVATKGGKAKNVKKLTIKVKVGKKLKKASSTKVKAGKATKLKVLPKPSSGVKKHVAVRYESTNAKVATVSTKGVVKGVGKGTCQIYAYAQNGVVAKISVKAS